MCDRWSALSSFPLEQSGKRMRTTSVPLVHRVGGDVAYLPAKHLQVACEFSLVTTFSPGGCGRTSLEGL
jgi:hypothetical protein